MKKHWYRNRKARHRRRQKECEKEPYGKYGILRSRRGKNHAAALSARAGSRCDRHGSRQSRLQRRSVEGGSRHESQAHHLRFLQSRHLRQRCEDFKIRRLRNQRSPAGGMFPQTMHVETVALMIRALWRLPNNNCGKRDF